MSIHVRVAACSRVAEGQRHALRSTDASRSTVHASLAVAHRLNRIVGGRAIHSSSSSSSFRNAGGSGCSGAGLSAAATWPGSQHPPAARFGSSSPVRSEGTRRHDRLPLQRAVSVRRASLPSGERLTARPSIRITCGFSSGRSGIGKNPSPGNKPGKRPSSSSPAPSPTSPSSSAASSSPLNPLQQVLASVSQQAQAVLPPPVTAFPWASLLSSVLARMHALLSLSFSLLLLPYLLSSSLGELAFALRQGQVLLAGTAAVAASVGCYWVAEEAGKEQGVLVKRGGAVGRALALVARDSTNLLMLIAVVCALLKASAPTLPSFLRVIVPFLANGSLAAVFVRLVLRRAEVSF
ncbi:hypothetical protein CLOM_g12978 [Closterium sp. NIES-68]|nr:hypothetical protein CLOM_g12978 [Closterium sp. NIES-68]GJP80068.1 hypothetical protein CLOP_g10302 [Closterium sp. NIES-67]GJP81872.1 hypothetical protein CLOP_g11992 [Closterium sp. NIES-67]